MYSEWEWEQEWEKYLPRALLYELYHYYSYNNGVFKLGIFYTSIETFRWAFVPSFYHNTILLKIYSAALVPVTLGENLLSENR